MDFNGFEVTPVGNATLHIDGHNHLIVSNIGTSGLDGVTINTEVHKGGY